MSTNPRVVLTLVADPELRDQADRIAAAAGVRPVTASAPLTRKTWLAAAAVLLDVAAARTCERDGLPRRDGVILISSVEPDGPTWAAAMAIGAQHVCALPGHDGQLVGHLADAAESASDSARVGRVIAVTGGRGGAGASTFATALAQAASAALLVDLDPWGGGIDLLLGSESAPGLRWPDLSLQGGRLAWAAVRDALPSHRGVSVLSSARHSHEIEAGAVEAIVDAGRRGGMLVICDLPRRMTAAVTATLDGADLVVVITTCDVRGTAAVSALAPMLRGINPNVGLVVRGPAPGGLRPGEVAEVAGLPLLAAMRPEPMVAERLERGGLRLRRRSPLGAAARAVLEVLPAGSRVRAA
ncbi:CpaE-like family protein [Mycobacterium sp. CVI_P3]|uniref:CpaE-like family protein n=1 Tax=Mycobacterium pinniadriaticum TaxID=2994102 RepID=A0ABT3SJ88_9MYCO|nr:septum site-determining protein Ssd [Mycobacterium pinniadriaticum]MCX2933101.1 CpaE-like family protein [Mycobacterium pinniadriaticum]MCX2939599.1 CpaE-like family protein [Mycobacterium pinniadriaticum]